MNNLKENRADCLTAACCGEFRISEKAISQICEYELSIIKSIYKVNRLKVTAADGALTINADVTMNFPCAVKKQTQRAAEKLVQSIEYHTGMAVEGVNINPKDLHIGEYDDILRKY